MLFKTAEECRAYVDAELDHLVQSRPGWHARRCLDVPVRPLSWSLSHDEKDRYDSSYTLEACMDHAEFLIWFGNYQVGAEGLHWIMRPAVHVAFEDLTPRRQGGAPLHSDRCSELHDRLTTRSYARHAPVRHEHVFDHVMSASAA